MRSMLAEIQERLDETEDLLGHDDRPGRWACERVEAPTWDCFARGCAPCVVAAHAYAMRYPSEWIEGPQGLMTIGESINRTTLTAALPLPLVPPPAPVEGDAEEGQQL